MVDSHLICSTRDLELEGKSGYWGIEGEDHRIHSHWYSIQQDSSSHIFLKGNGQKLDRIKVFAEMNQMFDLMPERVYNHQSYVRNESVVRPNAWKICSDISGDSASEQEQSGRYEDKIKMNK